MIWLHGLLAHVLVDGSLYIRWLRQFRLLDYLLFVVEPSSVFQLLGLRTLLTSSAAVTGSCFKRMSFSEEDACEVQVIRMALTPRRLKQI